ncbi:hypothetical protein F4604DRAFT_1878642 [Suillus subluteus]|nr:hypothetical protein F4604DRAFT_1878642 [Suillus subluteus]
MLEWFCPHAIAYISHAVSNEMDAVKEALRGTLDSVTPQFLLTWDLSTTIQDKVALKALILQHILCCAAQTEHAIERNKIKDSSTACNVIITQLASQCSHHSIFLTVPFTLFVWTNGASKQTIEALYKCGLCISFTSLLTLLEKLAAHCVEHARQVARQPHMMCYDNINISTSRFVEQCSDAPAKVQSGTFAILYEVRNGNRDHMHLSPMLNRALNATALTFNADVRPTLSQMSSFCSQLHIHIIDILLETCSNFKNYERPDVLQHSYRTKQFPLRTSTIDESSITGNITVIHDIIQLRFGLFHLCLNLIWALLHILRGIILNAWRNECGHSSLAAFASSKPTVDKLLQIANTIIIKHAMPAYESSSKKQNVFGMDSERPTDTAQHNLQLLTRDLLYVLELTSATSAGNWGWIEDILRDLAMIFRGAGSNNYCSEILHFLFNLKKIWMPEFACKILLLDIMRDNALINLTGLEGHCMPVDLNIEHHIKFLKVRLDYIISID